MSDQWAPKEIVYKTPEEMKEDRKNREKQRKAQQKAKLMAPVKKAKNAVYTASTDKRDRERVRTMAKKAKKKKKQKLIFSAGCEFHERDVHGLSRARSALRLGDPAPHRSGFIEEGEAKQKKKAKRKNV
jgi:hypothetical protein